MSAGTTLSLGRSDNMHKAFSAQLAAESGLEFMLKCLADADLSKNTDYETLMPNLAQALSGMLDETANLGDSTVSGTTTTVTIPAIAVEDAVFACVLTRLNPDAQGNQQCSLSVTGIAGNLSRRVSVDLRLRAGTPPLFDYGVASRGSIEIKGNAKLLSMGDPINASLFSAADDSTVIEATGNATIEGDLYTCTGDVNTIDLGGNVKVGGESDEDAILENHTHLNQDEPEFPELDLTPFPGLATATIDSSTDTSGNLTFTNVHVLPGANPTFNGNTTLNGIVYIEAPNQVKFNGNLVINGFVVTSDGGSLPLSGNQIEFSGNVSVPGVDALPDTPEFQDVKEHRGTAILAPGFGVTFKGNNSGINGLIAADQLTFRGNSSLGGELTGRILGLTDLPVSLRGNTTITINREDEDYTPTGFRYTASFEVIPSTYTESIP